MIPVEICINSFALHASLKTSYYIIRLEHDFQEENIFWLNIYVNQQAEIKPRLLEFG